MKPFIKTIALCAAICTLLLVMLMSASPAIAAGQLRSGVYTVDRAAKQLAGVPAGTSAAGLIDNMSNDAGSLSVHEKSGGAYSGGAVGTGMQLRLTEGGTAVDTLTIVVNGDANGDGKVTIADYTLVRLHILGQKTLEGAYFRAGDVNGNGALSIGDYTRLRLCILGVSALGDNTLPLAGYVIGLDPGHQRYANNELEPVRPGSTVMNKKVTSGTQGRFTRVPEYVVNLQVGLKLKDRLEELGAKVIMTRTSHDVNISNSQRALMMNKAGVDCWLRIHADGSSDASVHGASILVPAAGTMNTSDDKVREKSVRLAGLLIERVVSATGAKNRGIKPRSDQTGFGWSSVPVCTIEMGYMTNEREDKLLVTDAYQNKITDGLVQGFLDYFL
jgi:N-acetylmuramoyl-L-alanine amidase